MPSRTRSTSIYLNEQWRCLFMSDCSTDMRLVISLPRRTATSGTQLSECGQLNHLIAFSSVCMYLYIYYPNVNDPKFSYLSLERSMYICYMYIVRNYWCFVLFLLSNIHMVIRAKSANPAKGYSAINTA